MKKTTLAAQTGAGVAAIALLAALAQADSAKYSDVADIEFDMEQAALVAAEAMAGEIIEMELEMDQATAIWEVDIVNASNQVVTLEIDGQTGDVLSTRTDDDEVEPPFASAVNLAQAISLVKAVEQGSIVEAELENEDGLLVWEVESISTDDRETKFRVDAETGEVLI